MKPDEPHRRIEREFGVPVAGEILDAALWTPDRSQEAARAGSARPGRGVRPDRAAGGGRGLRQRPIPDRQRGLAPGPRPPRHRHPAGRYPLRHAHGATSAASPTSASPSSDGRTLVEQSSRPARGRDPLLPPPTVLRSRSCPSTAHHARFPAAGPSPLSRAACSSCRPTTQATGNTSARSCRCSSISTSASAAGRTLPRAGRGAKSLPCDAACRCSAAHARPNSTRRTPCGWRQALPPPVFDADRPLRGWM